MTRQSIDDLINAGKLASLTLPESSAMKTILKAMQTIQSDHLASLALPESSSMKTVRKAMETIQSNHLALQKSPAMKSFQQSIQAMQASFQASPALPESPAMKSIQQAMQASYKMLEFAPLARLADLPLLKAAAQLENSPFSKSTLVAFDTFTASFPVQPNQKILEMDSQISGDVSSVSDFNALSEKTQYTLYSFYYRYVLPMLFLVLGMVLNAAYGDELKEALESISTPMELHSFTRNAKLKFDKSLLAGFRVTTASQLRLRNASNKSAVIIGTLPQASLIEVLDGSNRSWLFVEVEMDGELKQGWVSRKYTAYFK